MTRARFVYPTLEQINWLYETMIFICDGGIKGYRDKGSLEYLLEIIQDDDYYPDIVSKLSRLTYGISHGHVFCDGNKRMGMIAGAYFLSINGLYNPSFCFLQRMESVTLHIANGNIDEELLPLIMRPLIQGKDYPENVKLLIKEAIE